MIANIPDFNVRHPRLGFDPGTASGVLDYATMIADQSVFWSTGPRVLTLSAGVDDLWFADVHRALGVDPPPLVCPERRTGRLVPDLLSDPAAMACLRRQLRDYERVQFVCWGATEDMYRLASAVQSFGHDVLLDIPAADDYWSSLYLDSKLSCLDLACRVPGLRTAPCVTTETWEELRGVLKLAAARGQTVIVRSAYGVGGEGAAVVDAEPGSLDRFWRTVRGDPLLRVFPLLVQTYLPHDPEFGCPAVDMLVGDDESGDDIAYWIPSLMTVEVQRFVGVNIGHGLLPDELTERLADVSAAVAAVVRRLGFRGWFGIDLLLDQCGDLYVTEFNARRTGGTEWIPLLDQRRPPGRAGSAVAHARPRVPLPAEAPERVSYRDMRPAFEDLWRQGMAVYPTAVRDLATGKRCYALAAIGADAAEAELHATTAVQQVREQFGGVRIGSP